MSPNHRRRGSDKRSSQGMKYHKKEQELHSTATSSSKKSAADQSTQTTRMGSSNSKQQQKQQKPRDKQCFAEMTSDTFDSVSTVPAAQHASDGIDMMERGETVSETGSGRKRMKPPVRPSSFPSTCSMTDEHHSTSCNHRSDSSSSNSIFNFVPSAKSESREQVESSQQYMVSYKNRATLLALLIFVIGVVAGTLCLSLGIRSARQLQQSQITKEADEITKSIQATWNEFRVTGLWMHNACHGRRNHYGNDNYENDTNNTQRSRDGAIAKSIGCTRDEFKDYYNHISSSGLSFESVFFMPNVTEEERVAVEAESRSYFENGNDNDDSFNKDLVDYLGFVKAEFNPDTVQFEPVSLPYYNETNTTTDNSDGDEPPPRAWYFPQHYMLPIHETNALFMDNDMTYSKAMWPFIENALTTMKPTITFPLPKFQDLSTHVQFYHPGIDHSESEYDPQYNAVAVVMVRICDLVSRAVDSKNENLNVYIYDVTSSSIDDNDDTVEGQFMCGVRINDGDRATTTDGGGTIELSKIDRVDARISQSGREYFREREISIEDRTWLVLVSDPNVGGNYQQPQILVPMLGGLVVIIASTLMAVWFRASTTRAARLQQLQAASEMEKAALLQNINVELNRQVKQRVDELREKERIAQEKSREAEQAEARSEAMVETMSMLSHELRTPLQGIMGVTTMVLEDVQASKQSTPAVPLSTVTGDYQDEGDEDTKSLVTANDRLEENLYAIQASSHLLLTLINNLLDVRKIDAGMMDDESFTPECLDLKVMVHQCVDTLKPLAALSDVQLNIRNEETRNAANKSGDDASWLAMGCPLSVQQVLINLVGNSIKYSSLSFSSGDGDCTSLDISVRRSTLGDAYCEAVEALCTSANRNEPQVNDNDRQKQVLIVDVRDRGNGIPLEEAHKVFGAFMMLKRNKNDRTKSQGFAQPSGSGLGLQLCTRIMDRMNGCVWCNNCDSSQATSALTSSTGPQATDDSRGCVFSFFLECPTVDQEQGYIRSNTSGCLDSQHRQPDANRTIPSFVPSEDYKADEAIGMAPPMDDDVGSQRNLLPVDIRKARVFVIDDVVINAKVLCKMLHRLGFQDVRFFTGGQMALKALEDDPRCNFILTDYMMPGMDGLQFATKVKEMYCELMKPCPQVVLCSADYSNSLRTKCEEAGVNRMLRKPITISDLDRFVNGKKPKQST